MEENGSGVEKEVNNNVAEGLSKNARKKLEKRERLRRNMEERKQRERVRKRSRNEARRAAMDQQLAGLSESQRADVFRQKREQGFVARCRLREERERFRMKMTEQATYHVCVDCGWNEEMSEKELRSLVKQIRYCYSAVSKWVKTEIPANGERSETRAGGVGVQLTVVGVTGRLKDLVQAQLVGHEVWPMEFCGQPLLERFSVPELVYLSSDASDGLLELERGLVYVVGGIVDRNRLKGTTINKAKQEGIAAKRLELDQGIVLQHGSPVLTVNHVVEILAHRANGLSWTDAYVAVLPPRKGIERVP
mmetsp:Transcript_13466/g.27512  ORF Transcript_13466/g.27512 Transcript_13466/m.27512 type:complete len:306 (+) Transcript_13466:244-1161(+)